MSQTQIQSVRWWHEAIIEWMLQNPDKPQRELAIAFGRSEAWISTIIHSDAFQAVYRERRDAHFARASTSVVQKAEALAHVALDALTDKISANPQAQTPKELRETSEMCMKALGFTARADKGAMIREGDTHNTLIVASPGALDEARKLMNVRKAFVQGEPGVIDVEADGSLGASADKVSQGGKR